VGLHAAIIGRSRRFVRQFMPGRAVASVAGQDAPIALRHLLGAARVEHRELDKRMSDGCFTAPL
jgi:hypothetical protein